GKDYSSLGAVADAVQKRHPEVGLVLADDIWPEERFFFRSDHFHFARKEVPALFFFSGVHEDYHQPSDELEKIDTGKVARIAEMMSGSARGSRAPLGARGRRGAAREAVGRAGGSPPAPSGVAVGASSYIFSHALARPGEEECIALRTHTHRNGQTHVGSRGDK